MADEQTGEFFMPPANDAPAFAAPAAGGEESQIGDVYYGSAPSDGDFFSPPAEPAAAAPSDGDFFNPPSEPSPFGEAAPYEAPPAAAEGDGAALGFAAPYEAPPAAAENLVEDVADDDAEDAAGGFGGAPLVPAEPTAMAKWNAEWQDTLLRRKDEENAIKAGHVEQARADIAAFQAEREQRRESRMAKNRSDEQDKLEAIEADLENDNSFQRVVKMIELNQDSSDGAADIGRMKDVLVLLKNEPVRVDALTA